MSACTRQRCVLGFWCVVLVGLVAPSSVLAQSKKGERAREKIALRFARDMAAGRFEAATKTFDKKMAEVMPAPVAEKVWGSLESQFGKFVSFGGCEHQKVDKYYYVFIETKFEKASRRLKVVFDKKKRIAGFFQEPIASPTGSDIWSPPSYDKPKHHTERDVVFGDAPWEVKGKLTMPASKAMAPVVVLVHGSGPHDEDETIGPNKPFKDLALGLASNGVAVLRYQKRTHAHKMRLVAQKTITVREEVIEDALAALSFVRRQPGIAKDRVFLLGHSLGATVGPEIATEDGHVAGLILMSGTPRDFCEVLEDQLKYIASLPGPGQAGNKKLYAEITATIAKKRSGDAPADAKILNVPLSYWDALTEHAQRSLKLIAKLDCRILITGGGRDYQVTEKDFALYRKALAGRDNATFHWADNLDHLYFEGDGLATPNSYAVPNHVSGEFVTFLAKWIRR